MSHKIIKYKLITGTTWIADDAQAHGNSMGQTQSSVKGLNLVWGLRRLFPDAEGIWHIFKNYNRPVYETRVEGLRGQVRDF